MSQSHYDTLEISSNASQADVKKAYRRLVKLFHPDSRQETASHDRITSLNAAYEILCDPNKRRRYDAELEGLTYTHHHASSPSSSPHRPQEPFQPSSRRHRRASSSQTADAQLQRWLKQVYNPIYKTLGHIIQQLDAEITDLSADPFDDSLLEAFEEYIDNCREQVERSQQVFQSQPNPSSLAGVASHLYYCLSQVGDGLDELERFISCYDEHYLHTGQELFRIADKLRWEAQASLSHLF